MCIYWSSGSDERTLDMGVGLPSHAQPLLPISSPFLPFPFGKQRVASRDTSFITHPCSPDTLIFLARSFPGDVGGPRCDPCPAVRLPGPFPPREACSGGILEVVQLPLHSGGGRSHAGVSSSHGRWEQRLPPYLPRALRLIGQ